MFKKLLLLIILPIVLFSGCSKKEIGSNEVNMINKVPNSFINGYEKADFNLYNSPGKENGLKYKKIFVYGKLLNEIKETSDNLNCDFADSDDNIWYLRLDKPRTSNMDRYTSLIGKDVCITGVYGGSLVKNPKPVIYVNRIYDIDSKEEIVSKFYENYSGELDENGKIISSDFDLKDNTQIDFHKLQIELPYNYKEAKINNDEYLSIIYEDGLFYIRYLSSDISSIANDWVQKNDYFNKIKNDNSIIYPYYDYLDSLSISEINDNAYKSIMSFDVETNSSYGSSAFIISDDGVYTVLLLSEKNGRFNRENDFSKIINSIKLVNQSKPVRSYGVNKKTYNGAYNKVIDKFITYKKIDNDSTLNANIGNSIKESKQIIVDSSNITISKRNALKSAQNYLNYSAFSYSGLIKQLEFEKYSHEDAVYAADNCGADWNEQAVKSAKEYLNYSSFSLDGLISQLEYEGFTSLQAEYGANFVMGNSKQISGSAGTSVSKQNALKSAQNYLNYSSFSYSGLIKQLEFEKYSHEDAVYAADNCGADWNEQAVKSAKEYLNYSSFSRRELIEQLEYEGFTSSQAEYGVKQNGY